jgi:hypothetical protein
MELREEIVSTIYIALALAEGVAAEVARRWLFIFARELCDDENVLSQSISFTTKLQS